MDQQLNWRVFFSVLLVLVHVTYSQLRCSSDIPTDIQYGATETIVNWEEPVPPPDYILVFQSYSQGTFRVGISYVEYIYEHQTTSDRLSCSFQVIVGPEDVTPPDITHCPTSIIFGVKPGIMETFVHWDLATATDNSGTVFTEVHGREGSYPVDTVLVVEYKFYDAANNTAVCTFQVSVVEDDEKPIILGCPTEDIRVVVPSNDTDAKVYWREPTVVDNTFIANKKQSQYSGNSFRVRNTTVEYLFIDSAGNNASCKFNVVFKYEQTEVSSGNDIIIIVLIVCLTVVIVVISLVLAFVIYLRHSKEVNTPRPNSELPATPGIPNESHVDLSARRSLPPSDYADYLTPSPN